MRVAFVVSVGRMVRSLIVSGKRYNREKRAIRRRSLVTGARISFLNFPLFRAAFVVAVPFLISFWLADVPTLCGQTKNPDISIIGDLRAFIHGDDQRPTQKNGLNLELNELELALQGYLNPYSRADVFLAMHGAEASVEVEEAAVTFLRGLPWGLNVKFGKYLVDFGKLNTYHPHLFPFGDRPLLHRIVFGEDGLSDTGVQVNWLLPTGNVYSNLSFNVLKGEFVGGHGHVHAGEGADADAGGRPHLAYSARLSAHFQLSDLSNLQVGFSGLTAVYDPDESLRMNLLNIDAKYKWKPDRYRSITLHGEWLLQRRERARGVIFAEKVNSHGLFAYVDVQFRGRWNAGGLLDFVQEPDDTSHEFWALGAFAGFSPLEESSVLRLIMKREKHPGAAAFFSLTAQLVFSLGPHKPHIF